MPLEKQVCSLELAKKLKELGVKQESYFWWGQSEIDDEPLVYHDCLNRALREPTYSAFTVAELGEMLPDGVFPKEGHVYNGQTRFLKIDKDYDNSWFVAYLPLDYEIHDETDNVIMTAEDTLADAMARMLIYLIENKLYAPQE